MGHGQKAEDKNLGLGWLYYSLCRIIRPRTVVCIGSWRGFAPVVLDNLEQGKVIFIDPSLVDEHWRDAGKTSAWFGQFGLDNITHYCMTTQKFCQTPDYDVLNDVGLLFVDGMHTAEQAEFDHLAFDNKLSAEGIVLFHDSVRYRTSYMYGCENVYEHTVMDYMDRLKKRSDLQVIDFQIDSGVTLVRKVDSEFPANGS